MIDPGRGMTARRTENGSGTQTMDQLKQTLQQLHRQLENADDVDPELQQWLRVLDEDIHKLLANRSGDSTAVVDAGDASTAGDSEGDGAGDDDDLASRADDVARRFAARHPQLEPVLREIADALARLGI